VCHTMKFVIKAVTDGEVCDGYTSCVKHRDDEVYCSVLGNTSLFLSALKHILEMCGISHSLKFPSVHSHDVSVLIPITVALPKFHPMSSRSHFRTTDERHSSLNNQTMINVKKFKQSTLVASKSQLKIILFTKKRCDVTTFYWIVFASSRPMGISAYMSKKPFPLPL